jgi:hypothetical protein
MRVASSPPRGTGAAMPALAPFLAHGRAAPQLSSEAGNAGAAPVVLSASRGGNSPQLSPMVDAPIPLGARRRSASLQEPLLAGTSIDDPDRAAGAGISVRESPPSTGRHNDPLLPMTPQLPQHSIQVEPRQAASGGSSDDGDRAAGTSITIRDLSPPMSNAQPPNAGQSGVRPAGAPAAARSRFTWAPAGVFAPLADGVAAGASFVSSALTYSAAGVSNLSKGWASASGGIWAAAAAMTQWGNPEPTRWASATNYFGMVAGAASGASAWLPDSAQTPVAMASSSLWLANAVASAGDAYSDKKHDATSRRLQYAAAAANAGAAALSFASAKASADNHVVHAATLSMVASVAWAGGGRVFRAVRVEQAVIRAGRCAAKSTICIAGRFREDARAGRIRLSRLRRKTIVAAVRRRGASIHRNEIRRRRRNHAAKPDLRWPVRA